MAKRRIFSCEFKATVALETLHGDKTTQEIAAKHSTQTITWKQQTIDALTEVAFSKAQRAEDN